MSFQFKQFFIDDSQCAMKVGTDGILLGSWAIALPLIKSTKSLRVLDIGCGSGLISVMLAQRLASLGADFLINAVDINLAATAQAQQNVSATPWLNNIIISHQDALTLSNDYKYDYIVSNPPFYHAGQTFDRDRQIARHRTELDWPQLASKVAQLLKPSGCFEVIIPASELAVLNQCLLAEHLFIVEQMNIKTTVTKAIKRVLLRIQCQPKPIQLQALTIHQIDGKYSADYQKLCKAFYLKF